MNAQASSVSTPLRQVVLDTETTGLDPGLGHRVIEIGLVEIISRRTTGRTLHAYFNPDRDSDPGALAIHGLTREFLADKPRFADQAEAIVTFLDGAEVLIHNAAFDEGFLNAEFAACERAPLGKIAAKVTDTVQLARSLYPGKSNKLDALCERLGVDNSHRTLHGALLDARLLADVYLAMTRGQEGLDIDAATPVRQGSVEGAARPRPPIQIRSANAEESAAHNAYLSALKGAIWSRIEASNPA